MKIWPRWRAMSTVLVLVSSLAFLAWAGDLQLYDTFDKCPLDPTLWHGIGQASGHPLDMLRAPDCMGSLQLGARGISGGHSRQGLAMLDRPETITGGDVYLVVKDWWAVGCQGSPGRTMTRVGFTMDLGHEYTARVMVAGVAGAEGLVVLGQIRHREGHKDARTLEEVELGPVPTGWPVKIGLSWYPGGVYFLRHDCTQRLAPDGRTCGKAGRWDSIAVPVTRLAKPHKPPEPSRVVEAVSEAGTCEASDVFSLSAVHEVYAERTGEM